MKNEKMRIEHLKINSNAMGGFNHRPKRMKKMRGRGQWKAKGKNSNDRSSKIQGKGTTIRPL